MATDVRVGARMETVAPRPVTDTGDRWRLAALVLVGVAVHLVVVSNTTVTARDSIGFARYALELEDPESGRPIDRGPDGVTPVPKEGPRRTQVDVLLAQHHPPGYPIAVLAASHAVRAADPAATLPDRMLRSTQLASAVAGVLLLFPTYWLGRMLFGKTAGFVAALFTQILPAFAEHTSDGETEGLYLLGIASALALGVWAVRKPDVGRFLLCGLATGFTYLIRPEGLVPGMAVVTVVCGLILFRRWSFGAGTGRLTALLVGTLAAALPYMILIGGVTNKPTGGDIFGKLINLVNPKAKAVSALTGPALFADRYQAEDGPRELWVPKTVLAEATKAVHYAPAALAVVGLLAAGRRFRGEPALWVPAVAALFVTVVISLLGYVGTTPNETVGRQHYISERHTMPLAYIACLFAAAGVEALPRWLGRVPLRAVVLTAVVLSCVPKLVRPLHDERSGQREAGLYLADKLQPDDTVIDPYEWAKFYAGRSVRAQPPDLPDPDVAYAVLRTKDLKTDPGSLLPQLGHARNVANDGRSRVVFQWPPDVGADAVTLRIYKFDKRPIVAAGGVGGSMVVPIAGERR